MSQEQPENILSEAYHLVHGDRQQDYGDALQSVERVAMMWSAILGVTVRAEQVPLCMLALKISRECNRAKRDNRVDMAGYAELLQIIVEKQQQNAVQHECDSIG